MPDDRLLIESQEFWRARLDHAENVEKEPHKAVWNVERERWDAVGEIHRTILADLLIPGQKMIRLLDCGCGTGELISLLPTGVDYFGIDLSPDLLGQAQSRFPTMASRLSLGDLRDLPYGDQEFDVAVARSIEGMVIENLGVGVWQTMEREILRVAKRLILLSYGEPSVVRIVDITL